jgi:transcription antitermination factor NusG
MEKSGSPANSSFGNHPWYALKIRPRFEKLAARHLRDKGYVEYLPLHKSTRRWSDRIKTAEFPLVPGYMFCRFDIQDMLPILLVPGVLSVVGVGKALATIPESQISSIQQAVDSKMRCEAWPFVQVGQSISVESGPLAGLKGIVVEVKSSFRLILSVPLLQRSVAVEIESHWTDFDRAACANRLLKIAQ